MPVKSIATKNSLSLNRFSILGILTSISIMPTFMDPVNIIKLLFLVCGVGILIISSQSSYIKRTDTYFLLTHSLAFFIIIWFIVSSLFNSQSIYALLFGTWGRNNGLIYYLSIFSLMFMISATKKIESVEKVLHGLFSLGILFSFYAWMQHYNLDPVKWIFPWYDLNGNIALTLGNSNFASVMLGITFTATLGKMLDSKRISVISFLGICSLIMHILLIPLIDTQGKLVYGVGGSLVFGIWLAQTRLGKITNAITSFWWLITTSAGVFGVLGLFGNGIFAGVLRDNVRNLEDRYYHWVAAINIIKSHPWFGVGIDSFGDWHRRFRVQASIDLRGTPMSGTDNAHNIFLQLGSTAGLPVLIAYLMMVLLITFFGLVAIQRNKGNISVGTLFAVWIVYIIQSIVSIDQIGVGVWGWIIAGTLIRFAFNENQTLENENRKIATNNALKNRNVLIGFSSFFLILVIAIIPTIIKEYNLLNKLQNLGNLRTQVDFQKRSSDLLVEAMEVKQPRLRIIVATYLGKAGAADKALALVKDTAQKYPNELEAWHLIASIYESRRQFSMAIDARKKTIELDPLNEDFRKLLKMDLETGTSP